jgi:hypothetical protein
MSESQKMAPQDAQVHNGWPFFIAHGRPWVRHTGQFAVAERVFGVPFGKATLAPKSEAIVAR